MKTPVMYLAIKQFLMQASFKTGLTSVLHFTWPAGRHDGTIMIYHSVNHGTDYPFLPSQMRVSPTCFDQQMAYLARSCQVIRLNELGRTVRNCSKLPFRAVALTFDDGFKDNLTYALPILSKYGFTATFFVVTEWVGARQLSWLHRLYYLVWLKPADEVVNEFLHELRLMGHPGELEPGLFRRYGAGGTLRHLLLNKVTPTQADSIANAMWKRMAPMSTNEERELAGRLYLSWSDIDRLVSAGMDIGCHTASHPKLPLLSGSALQAEIARSSIELEERLGKSVGAFSYPFGNPDSFNDECRWVLHRIGFEVACALVGGSGRPGQDPLALGRLPVEDVSQADFALEITGLLGSLRMARSRLRMVWSKD